MCELTVVGVLKGGEIRCVSLGHLSNLTEGSDSSTDDATGFGITNGLLDLEKAGKELRKEGSDNDWGVDEFGHIVDDPRRIA